MPAPQTSQTWQRSSFVGITPLTVKPRLGKKLVTKSDFILKPSNAVPGSLLSASGTSIMAPPAAGGVERVCSVCTRRSAGYSCPRCLIAYCSSKCYKVHGSSCTEAFFREHVEREINLRDAEEGGEGESRNRQHQENGAVNPASQSGVGVGVGVGGAKERRAQMVEVLRRLRRASNKNYWKPSESSPVSSDLPLCSSAEWDNGRGGNRKDPARAGDIGERGDFATGGMGTSAAVHDEGSNEGNKDGEANGVEGDTVVMQLTDDRLEALARALETCDISGSTKGLKTAQPRRAPRHEGQRELRSGDGVAEGTDCSRLDGDRRDLGRAAERIGAERMDLDDSAVMNLLTEAERARFLREVASGRLGKLIVPWAPWWTHTAGVQEIAPFENAGNRTTDDSENDRLVATRNPSDVSTLSGRPSDSSLSASSRVSAPPTEPPTPEKLRSGSSSRSDHTPGSYTASVVRPTIAGFGADQEVLCARHTLAALTADSRVTPDFSTLSAHPPSPTLPALAADLVYAYVFVARLYNGCWCSDPVGASLALVGVSPVLRDGATPGSVAAAVSACVERAVEAEGLGSRHYAESLRKDVLALLEDDRKMGCALQDAWAMLDAAGKSLAPRSSSLCSTFSTTTCTSRSQNAKLDPKSTAIKYKGQQKKAAKELGRVEKRLSYFLLWARSHGAEVAPLMAADLLAAEVERRGRTEAFRGVRDGEGTSQPGLRIRLP